MINLPRIEATCRKSSAEVGSRGLSVLTRFVSSGDSSLMEARWIARLMASKRTAFSALDC